MNKFLILAASSLTLATASPALASDSNYCGNVTGQWMSQDEARAKVAEKGFNVRRIDAENGCYEAYAIDKNGARVEIYINPVTGEIVKTKNKSRS